MAFLCYFGQLMLSKSLGKLKRGRGTMLNYLQMIYAAIFGYFFLNEKEDLLSIVGSCLIFFSAMLSICKNLDIDESKIDEDKVFELL